MIRKHFSPLLLSFYALLGLVFLARGADHVVRALAHTAHYISTPWVDPPLALMEKTGDFGRNLSRLIKLDRVFRSLEERGLLLKLERRRWEVVEAENRRLTAILGLPPLPHYSALAARVWSREPGDWFRSLVVRRGENDGVKVSDPVIVLTGDRESLLGQVTEVFADTARVTLLTDVSFAASARVDRSGEQGAVEGLGRDRVALNYLYPDTEVRPGDEVTTAGLGGIFPEGLWVGTVTLVETPAGESFRRAVVAPAARISRVTEVLILRKTETPPPPTVAAPGERT